VLLTACDVLDNKIYDGYGHHHVDDFKVHPANSAVVFVVPEYSFLELLSLDAAERTLYSDSEWVSAKCESFIHIFAPTFADVNSFRVHIFIIEQNLTLIGPLSVPPGSCTPPPDRLNDWRNAVRSVYESLSALSSTNAASLTRL
jgi:hypothetical protein